MIADGRPGCLRRVFRWKSRLAGWLRARVPRRFSSKDTLRLGTFGEDLARRELERRGYVILERRVRGRLGEIDIVARDGSALVFVEVKTRTGFGYGRAVEAVDWRKQRKLLTLARSYVHRRGLDQVPVRFDVVGVEVLPGRAPRFEVVQGALEES